MAGIRSRFSPHITDDTSVLEKPISAWEHIFAAQTTMPKPSPSPEKLLQDIDWEQCIDIRDFGAKINGVSDDSDAIRAAIKHGKAQNTNVLICLPPGTIGIGSAVKIPSNVHLHGAGKNLTTLKALASMVAVLTGEDTAAAGTDLISNVIFSNFQIDATSFASRCVGPLQATGSTPAATFYSLTLVDFRMFGATAVNFMATTDNTLQGSLVGLDVATSNAATGMVLHYSQVLLLDYDGADTNISLNLVGIGDGSVIQGRSSSPTFVYSDNAGLGGSGAISGAHLTLVHEGTGPAIDVEDVFGGMDECIIHIVASGPHATNPIVDWNTPTSSPNQIKGNFVTIIGDVSTRPGVAYGTQVGNNTYNVVHHLLPSSTAPKYTGTIGNNSVNLDLLTLGGGASVFAPSDGRYYVHGLNTLLTNEHSIRESDASTITAADDLLFKWAEGNRRDFQIENLTALGSAVFKTSGASDGSAVVFEGYVATEANPRVQVQRAGLYFGPGGAVAPDTSLVRTGTGTATFGGELKVEPLVGVGGTALTIMTAVGGAFDIQHTIADGGGVAQQAFLFASTITQTADATYSYGFSGQFSPTNDAGVTTDEDAAFTMALVLTGGIHTAPSGIKIETLITSGQVGTGRGLWLKRGVLWAPAAGSTRYIGVDVENVGAGGNLASAYGARFAALTAGGTRRIQLYLHDSTTPGDSALTGAMAIHSAANNPSAIRGKLHVGGNVLPTALLHLAAGAAGASLAPLKFTSGTLQTTAEAGANEFLTDKFYGVITTGAARKEFALIEPTAMVAALAIALDAGTYTPTLTNVANLDASTAYQCQWSRVGKIVTVSGKVDVDPTTTVTATQLGISLPVASNLGAQEDCAGSAFASGIAGQGAAIRGDAANNRAEMAWIATDVTNQPMYFTFQYEVI